MLQVLEGAAYVGFIAGAIFAVLELRGISKDRRANTVVDMYTTFVSSDMTEAYARVMTGVSESGAEMEKECSYASLVRVAGFYEGVGYLARKRLVDQRVVMDLLPIPVVWRKMQPWLMFDRERTAPGMWGEFEYLGKATEVYDAKSEYVAGLNADLDALKAREKRKRV
jgi:hypothetical protein